jgi:hypothetical protein
MSTEQNSSPAWIGFPGLLTIAFIVLKLTKVIAWSWWLVLLPLWGPTSIALLIGLIALVIGISKLIRK